MLGESVPLASRNKTVVAIERISKSNMKDSTMLKQAEMFEELDVGYRLQEMSLGGFSKTNLNPTMQLPADTPHTLDDPS